MLLLLRRALRLRLLTHLCLDRRSLRQLLRHPSRTNDPEAASLFVVPVLPYASLVAGDCLGVTHEVRMRRAAAALSRSHYLQRSGGRDRLLLTTPCRMRAIGALPAAFPGGLAPRAAPEH